MLTYAGVCGRMLYIYVQLLRWCPSLDQMHTVFNPNADVIYGVLRYSLYALMTYADVCYVYVIYGVLRYSVYALLVQKYKY